MLYIWLLISLFALPVINHCKFSNVKFSGSVAVDFLDTEPNRSHFFSGSQNLDGVASLDLNSLEIYLDGKLSGDTVFSAQMDWDGNSVPTLELAYLRFQNAFGHGNILDVGKIINPLGNFIYRKNAQFNPLYGNPLIYDYRTNLRTDSYPTNTAEILNLKNNPNRNSTHTRNNIIDGIANVSDLAGMPLISPDYPTGITYYSRKDNIDYYLGISNNSLSNPTNVATSKHKNFFIKIAYAGSNKSRYGINFSAGSYLNNRVPFPDGFSSGDYLQKMVGFDYSYKRENLNLNAELVFNSFESPRVTEDLETTGYYVEAQYFWEPKFYGAIRIGGLIFGDVSTANGAPTSWDHDRDRSEFGLGYYLNEDVLTKFFVQNNDSDNLNVKDNLFGLQLNAVF